ncbi:TPM domain-containing protein [Fontimonas sp. SYSU GA230001]|uniref:TPM domain-containing protein n=1 Tax=Fontimonas sp. SYSU GA230001 TaxID=3142450 RepID=UPI0032B434BE
MRMLLVTTLMLLPFAARGFDVPPFTPNVVDTAGVLDAAAQQTINDELQRIRAESHIWGAVLIVGTLGGEPIENVAVQTFEKWQLGRRGVDNGLLLVLAMSDRQSRFEVGYGLEGAIPDVVALRALDAYLAPKMRAGDTAGAIVDAFAFLSRVVAQDPDALRELSEAESVEEFDWPRGFIALGVFLFALWFTLPIRNAWVTRQRARLHRLAPSLSLDDEDVVTSEGAGKGWKGSLVVQGFLSINPGAFVLILSALFVQAFYISIGAVLMIMVLLIHGSGRKYASPERYRRFLEDLARRRAEMIEQGHLRQSASGAYEYTPAYYASRASSSSSSGSSGSSSSSGGGSSGGGGASSRW